MPPKKVVPKKIEKVVAEIVVPEPIPEPIVVESQEIRGKNVSGRIWAAPKKKFTNGLMFKKQNLSFEEKKEFKEMKELEKKLKGDAEKDRTEEKRRIQQKRRAKEEKALKEKHLGPFKQAKKSKGNNQVLRKKDWKRVKGALEFGVRTNQF
jgi:hypothetical protein